MRWTAAPAATGISGGRGIIATTVTDIVCPFCGTLCDDLKVVISDSGTVIREFSNTCTIGVAKLLHLQSEEQLKQPLMKNADEESLIMVCERCSCTRRGQDLMFPQMAPVGYQMNNHLIHNGFLFGQKRGNERITIVRHKRSETDADDPEKIEQAFGNTQYLFKSGEMVVCDGEIISNGSKWTYRAQTATNEKPFIKRDIVEKFRRYYTVSLKNYVVVEGHSHLPDTIEINGRQLPPEAQKLRKSVQNEHQTQQTPV